MPRLLAYTLLLPRASSDVYLGVMETVPCLSPSPPALCTSALQPSPEFWLQAPLPRAWQQCWLAPMCTATEPSKPCI